MSLPETVARHPRHLSNSSRRGNKAARRTWSGAGSGDGRDKDAWGRQDGGDDSVEAGDRVNKQNVVDAGGLSAHVTVFHELDRALFEQMYPVRHLGASRYHPRRARETKQTCSLHTTALRRDFQLPTHKTSPVMCLSRACPSLCQS